MNALERVVEELKAENSKYLITIDETAMSTEQLRKELSVKDGALADLQILNNQLQD